MAAKAAESYKPCKLQSMNSKEHILINGGRRRLRARKAALDAQFKFTPENTAKIKEINAALLRKSHEIFDKALSAKHVLETALKNGKSPFVLDGEYEILGEISIESDREELTDIILRQPPYSISLCAADTPDRVSILMEEDNWDIEIFKPLSKYSIHICHAMHHFFCDGFFALPDTALISACDIQISLTIQS